MHEVREFHRKESNLSAAIKTSNSRNHIALEKVKRIRAELDSKQAELSASLLKRERD